MIFAIILAAWLLKEKMTKRKLAAVCMAASGVVLITLAQPIEMWLRATGD
ncbi:MAG: hypothetical protein IPK83_24490 [Planctomycetes bacterium]|nr:hypothetical protein [Planctomycetota bacterium]